jgi:hypothetical protein
MIASQPTPVLHRPRKSGSRIDVSTLTTTAPAAEVQAAPAAALTFRSRAARLALRTGELLLAAIVIASFAPAILLMHLARWLDSK